MNEWEQAVRAIKEDRRQGASQLALQSLQILEKACEQLPALTCTDFLEKINKLVRNLAAARPTMLSIGNTMNWLEQLMQAERTRSYSLPLLRQRAGRYVRALIDYHRDCRSAIAQKGGRVIPHDCKIMTCSYSSHVLNTLFLARSQGKMLDLVILESRWEGCSYGEILARQLEPLKISYQIIPDDRVHCHISGINIALIGGDALLPEGCLVNGYPSRSLAEAAADSPHPVPVWALMESLKISRQSRDFPVETGFQALPLSWLAGVVTEQGIIPGSADIKEWVDRPFPSLVLD